LSCPRSPRPLRCSPTRRSSDLLLCYPDRDPFDIRVLGGAEVPTRVLAGLPANWTVAPFGSLTPREFLAEIDLMVYFIAADGLEADRQSTRRNASHVKISYAAFS